MAGSGSTYLNKDEHMNDRIDSLILSTIADISTPVSEDDAWDAFKTVVDADGHLQHMLEYELADEESLFEDFLQDTNLNIV
jgi:hypothetical protein